MGVTAQIETAAGPVGREIPSATSATQQAGPPPTLRWKEVHRGHYADCSTWIYQCEHRGAPWFQAVYQPIGGKRTATKQGRRSLEEAINDLVREINEATRT